MSKRAAVTLDDSGVFHVRQSAIGQYGLCPQSVFGVDDAPSEATTFGTAFHFYPEALAKGEDPLPSAQNAARWIEQALDLDEWSWADTGWPRSRLHDMAEELSYAVESFHAAFRHSLPWDTAEAEVQASGWAKRRNDILITGTPDLVEWRTMEFWDWKTSRSAWHETRPSKEQQARLYPFLVDPQYSGPVDFHFVVYDRTNWEWDVHTVTTTHEERVAWWENASRIAELIVLGYTGQADLPYRVISDNFVARRNWFCQAKYCPHWNACLGKFMFDDGKIDLNEIRVMEWGI